MKIPNHYTARVDKALNSLDLPETPESLYGPCRYVLENGGKRIRPVLTLMANGLCGGEVSKAVSAALSVELIHNFTLVHDDIMDGADSRRGKPSVHVRWDQAAAILAGDILYAEAFEQLLAYSGDEYHDLNRTLLRAIRTVCEGQALDLELEQSGRVTVDQYLQMIEGKTSALISGALEMGGISAGASVEQLEFLRSFGRKIGIAFQIQDDLMDAVADPEKFGKKRGGDIMERKKTFLLLNALEYGNEEEVQELYRLIRKEEILESDVENVIQLYYRSGAVRRAEEIIGQKYSQAELLLKQFDDSVYKEDLVNLVNNLTDREH